METIERIVYIFVSIVILGMIFGVMVGYDYNGIFGETKDAVSNDGENLFLFNEKDYIFKIHKLWQDCGFGEVAYNRTYIAQFNDKSFVIDYDIFMSQIKNLHLCDDISDVELSCGLSKTIGNNNFEIHNAGVYRVECRDGQLYIDDLA